LWRRAGLLRIQKLSFERGYGAARSEGRGEGALGRIVVFVREEGERPVSRGRKRSYNSVSAWFSPPTYRKDSDTTIKEKERKKSTHTVVRSGSWQQEEKLLRGETDELS